MGFEASRVYPFLVESLRVYLGRYGFSRIVVGLSGGVDSAFCAVLASEVVGSSRVQAVFLPSRYTSEESKILSEKCARNLGVSYMVHSIDGMHSLGRKILGVEKGIVDENLQSRIRGLILMGVSNRDGGILLRTGNKSEVAMGYCTLYGDTCGGFAPIGDVYKTQVYELCDFVNRDREIIPDGILAREPSAELSAGQKDSDSIPPYEELDEILCRFIEGGEVPSGDSSEVEKKVWDKLVSSEYKRNQYPPCPKVSSCPLGTSWKAPKIPEGSVPDGGS